MVTDEERARLLADVRAYLTEAAKKDRLPENVETLVLGVAERLYEGSRCDDCPIAQRLTFAPLAALKAVSDAEHVDIAVVFAAHALHKIARLEEANRQLRERIDDLCANASGSAAVKGVATDSTVLAEELATYAGHLPELLVHHDGKFVLIKGTRIVGAFDSPQAAYEKGLRYFGNVPMLIREVRAEQCVETS